MKIKLSCDLPIDKNCGAIEGAIFDVLKVENSGRQRNKAYFLGVDGQRCAAFSHEYELVKDGE